MLSTINLFFGIKTAMTRAAADYIIEHKHEVASVIRQAMAVEAHLRARNNSFQTDATKQYKRVVRHVGPLLEDQ